MHKLRSWDTHSASWQYKSKSTSTLSKILNHTTHLPNTVEGKTNKQRQLKCRTLMDVTNHINGLQRILIFLQLY